MPLLQMLCSSNTSHLVVRFKFACDLLRGLQRWPNCCVATDVCQDGTPRASKRLLRHFELVGMYDCGNKSHGTAFIDQQSQAAIFPPFKDARLILEGIAHRLLLSTRDAIPHFYVSEAAKEMADATLEGAKVLLSMALAPVPATAGGVLVLSEIQPRGPADSLQQTGSTSRLHSLTFRRLERIVQRARSVLCRQAAAAEESGTTTAVLRKQVRLRP